MALPGNLSGWYLWASRRHAARTSAALASLVIGAVESRPIYMGGVATVRDGAEEALSVAQSVRGVDQALQLALQAARNAVAIDPAHAKAHNLIGACLANLGRRDEARTAFETSIKADPREPGTYTNLANLELQQDDRRLDPRKPFAPFGSQPAVGSRLYLSHPELVRARLRLADLGGSGPCIEPRTRSGGVESRCPREFHQRVALADEATRDALSWLKCQYMSDKLGEEDDRILGSPLKSRWSYSEAKAIEEILAYTYYGARHTTAQKPFSDCAGIELRDGGHGHQMVRGLSGRVGVSPAGASACRRTGPTSDRSSPAA